MKLKIEGDLSARNFSLSKESYTLVLNLSLPIDSLELSVAKIGVQAGKITGHSAPEGIRSNVTITTNALYYAGHLM